MLAPIMQLHVAIHTQVDRESVPIRLPSVPRPVNAVMHLERIHRRGELMAEKTHVLSVTRNYAFLRSFRHQFLFIPLMHHARQNTSISF